MSCIVTNTAQRQPDGLEVDVAWIDILQSQLFLLKVLSYAMASRWGSRDEDTCPQSRDSKLPGSKPATPDSAAHGGRSRHASTEQLSVATTLVEPPSLDDNCAKYIISVMVLLLRQAARGTVIHEKERIARARVRAGTRRSWRGRWTATRTSCLTRC